MIMPISSVPVPEPVHRFSERSGSLIPTLWRRKQQGDFSAEQMTFLARSLGLPEARVCSVSSYYPAFRANEELTDWASPPLKNASIIPRAPYVFVGSERRVTARCGIESDAETRYAGLCSALSRSPEQVCSMIVESGLRGRGGAGFPTGLKWQSAKNTPSDERFVICNAAEGDLGAFMDLAILESDVYSILEGMAIAAYAIGARKGYVYIREEYHGTPSVVTDAIVQAGAKGFLGKRILGSDFDFEVEVFRAAGMYVCGEETALINSMEGRTGRPRMRPPFPTQAGLWGKPTVVNNVKTLGQVAFILREGVAAFSSVGTEKSRGTAVLSFSGNVVEPVIVEVPMGVAIEEVLREFVKVPGGKRIKALQTGGPLGGVIPAKLFGTPVSYEAMSAIGSPLGSGGMIVLDENTDMLEVACDFARFAAAESCGHCAPCRLGTAEIVRSFEDRPRVEAVAETLRTASFCAFGQSAANLTLSILRHFGDEDGGRSRSNR